METKTIPQMIEDEKYLDEKFPKGKSKLRGEAMVLLTLARRRGKQEAQKMFLEEELEFFRELLFSYNSRWFKEKIKKRIEELKSKIGGKDETK